ncbi:MAG: SDR family NAD(P)-dependent oxidoreductase [Bdellovibrionales bacterium]|nr:SDR family NAD(P)-dependent oxidoreductase [Bdellovibrionales bacterium]
MFSGSAKWTITPSEIGSHSGICFVYPGQGAMFPGMAQGFENNPHFSKYFKRADFLAKKANLPSVSAYAFTPRELTLEQKEAIESLALFTYEIAMTQLLVVAGYRPQVVTGHSFGEYACLVTSGIWGFDAGFKSIVFREQSLPEKNSLGYMVAIASSDESLKELLPNQQYYISNKNSRNQTVISTSWECLPEIESTLSKKEIKFKRLSSPQPFHSPFLDSAAKKMKVFAEEANEFSQIRTDFFSGVLKSWVLHTEERKSQVRTLIADQLIEPVDFELQIKMIEKKCHHFIEVGPRPFLTEIIKSNFINSKTKATAALALVEKPEKLMGALTTDRSQVTTGILNRVNAIISRFTGYAIQDIKFEDKFQEDLGIDSIKIMEISMEVIKDLQLSREFLPAVAQIKTVGELAYRVQKQIAQGRPLEAKKGEAHFSLYQEQYIRRERFNTDGSNEAMDEPFIVNLNYKLDLSILLEKKTRTFSNLIFRFSHDEFQNEQTLNSLSGFSGFCEQIKTLLVFHQITPATRVAIISDKDSFCLPAVISSFFKSLKKENAIGFVAHIIFDSNVFSQTEKIEIAKQDLVCGVDTDIKYSHDTNHLIQRWVVFLEKVPALKSDVPTGGILVAVGGAKGITASLVEHLIRTSQWEVHLIGRSCSDDPSVQATIVKLKHYSRHVYYYQVDASNRDELEKVFSSILKVSSKIDLLIQGAGIELSRKFIDKSRSEIEKELIAKATTTLNVGSLGDQYQITYQVLLSSIVARFGNSGQSVYSAANTFAEVFWRSCTVPHLKKVIIQWAPWDKIGMTESPIIYEVLKGSGVSLLPKEQAGKYWDAALHSGGGVVWDPNDRLLYEGPLSATRCFGTSSVKIVPINSSLTIQFPVSTQSHQELIDHTIDNKTILPLALTSYWFLEMGKLLTRKAISLQDLNIFLPLEITSVNKQLSLIVDQDKNNIDILKMTLFDGGTLIANAIVKSQEEASAILEDCDAIPIVTRSSSEFYAEGGLFHGPLFRRMEKVVFYGDTEARAQLCFPWPQSSVKASWLPRVLLIDSAFQLLALAGLELKKWKGLPVGAEEIQLSDNLSFTEPLFWRVSNLKIQENFLKGELKLFNSSYLCLGVIKNAKFRCVKD